MVSYFSTFGRIYQLNLGTILAIIVLLWEKPHLTKINYQKMADILSVFVLIFMISIVLLCEISTLNLGIIMTILTFALILTLEISSESGFLKKLVFHNSFFRQIGKLSYGIYVTHVPIIKFGEITGFFLYFGFLQTFVTVAAIFFVSTLLWHFVEEPVSRLVRIERRNAKRIVSVFLMLNLAQTFMLSSILDINLENLKQAGEKSYHPKIAAAQNLLSEKRSEMNSKNETKANICNRLSKYGLSIYIAGDSYANAWLNSLNFYHNFCNISEEFIFHSKIGCPYLPLENAQGFENHAMINVRKENLKLYAHLEKKPNLTLFFSRSIHTNKMWYKNEEPFCGCEDLEKWKTQLRKVFLDFLPYVFNYTTPVFVIEHPHPIDEKGNPSSPSRCLKKLEYQFGKDWMKHTDRCKIKCFPSLITWIWDPFCLETTPTAKCLH